MSRLLTRNTVLIVVIALGVGLLALLVILDAVPALRGGFGWQWPYEIVPFARAIPFILAVIVYVVGAILLTRFSTRDWHAIFWAVVGVIVLTVLVVLLRHDDVIYELFTRTASRLTTGQHRAAAQIGWGGEEWRDWATFVSRPEWFGGHVAVAPPGIPLAYSVFGAAFDALPGLSQPLYRVLLPYQCSNYELLGDTPGEWASAWFGVLMPLWAALSILPLYKVSKLLPMTRSLARSVVLWYPLIPALLMFSPTWNTLYPLFSLVAFWLLHTGLERRSLIWIGFSGLVMGSALFANYTFAPFVGFLVFYTLIYLGWGTQHQGISYPFGRLFSVGFVMAVGILIPWVLYALWSGETPLDLVAAAFSTHLDLDRPYLPWVFLHIWDWIFFNGVALAALWLVGVGLWVRRRTEPTPTLPLALLLTITLLAVSGTTRGEAGRVWSLFTPFLLLAAAEGLHRLTMDWNERRVWWAWAGLTVGSAGLVIALATALNVIGTDLQPPPTLPNFVLANAADAMFADGVDGGTIRLTGWEAQADGNALILKLGWESIRQSTEPYWFSAVLVAPDGAAFDAGVWQPGQATTVAAGSEDAQAGQYPATCWKPGSHVTDQIRITLPANAPAGDWWISLAIYGAASSTQENRLSVTLPDGAQDTQVGIGPVSIQS